MRYLYIPLKLRVRSRGRCPSEMGLPLCSESIFPIAGFTIIQKLTRSESRGLPAQHDQWQAWSLRVFQVWSLCIQVGSGILPASAWFSKFQCCSISMSSASQTAQHKLQCIHLHKPTNWVGKGLLDLWRVTIITFPSSAQLKSESQPCYLCFILIHKSFGFNFNEISGYLLGNAFNLLLKWFS